MSHSLTPHSRIAIVGAGISGLACARALADAGLHVQVFEKSRGVAGRMSTRRGEHGQCDHGAQYFTARDPEFRAEVQTWIAAGAAALWAPRMRVYEGEAAADWHPHSSSVERFVGTPAMASPGRVLAHGLTVHHGFNVRALQHKAGKWQLDEVEGATAAGFDAVLLAMPAPQAQALLKEVAPALAAHAGSVQMRPSWALMLHCDGPLPLPFDAAFVNAGPLRWVARDSSKPGRPGQEVWLLHGTAQWSAHSIEADREAVTSQMLAAFQTLTGIDLQPRIAGQSLHRWMYADTGRTLGEPCVWNAQCGAGLCGDWLQEDKVEGAWRSGRALAAKVIDAVSANVRQVPVAHPPPVDPVQCRRISFGSAQYRQTLLLRETVLRIPLGLTLSEADVHGEEGQWHFALQDGRDALLANVVAVPLGDGLFKLRQMAVRADLQGLGLGSRLLTEVEGQLRVLGARTLILHARVSVVPFYQMLGYVAEGEDFLEVTIAHRCMRKSLTR
jgi:predicted NAD/FAD-dependent oxidoreductase/GNAT superfamily N-acetyltransferase